MFDDLKTQLTPYVKVAWAWAVARLKEPSTFAGGGIFAMAITVAGVPPAQQSFALAICAGFGSLAVAMSEKKV
jgi:hypothetical protein